MSAASDKRQSELLDELNSVRQTSAIVKSEAKAAAASAASAAVGAGMGEEEVEAEVERKVGEARARWEKERMTSLEKSEALSVQFVKYVG